MTNYLTDIKMAKKSKALDDFDFLLKDGVVGFYKTCEIYQIFLLNTKTKRIINYYTLFCFCELELTDDHAIPCGITKLNETMKIGCQKQIVSIEKAKDCFSKIQKGVLDYDEPITVPNDLYLLPKVLVSTQVIKNVFIKDIIKPNYWGDSYIIEFYDEGKSLLLDLGLESEAIEIINKFSFEKLNLNLAKSYDRIGNIIFQFPITVQYSKIQSNKNSVDFRFQLASHPKLLTPNNYEIQLFSSLDHLVTGFDKIETNSFDIDKTISPGDDNSLCTIIIDKSKSILLKKSEVNFVRSFNFIGRIGTQYSEPRFIKDRNGKLENIELYTSTNMGENKDENDYFSRIIKRNINNKVISQSGDCMVFKKNQREEALQFLRNKIQNLSDIKEICLWDPYLTAFDIIETLYFENTGIPFRCITEFKHAKKINDDGTYDEKKKIAFSAFCRDQKKCFLNNSNNLRIRLKFLAQHDVYGWEFHDRFLILIPKNISDLPIVYSLGISVNQIGESHHTIQKVTDPRTILANFEELWKLLDNGECLVAEF